MDPNLELIINDEPWNVIIVHDDDRPYFKISAETKTLYINDFDVDVAKHETWKQYHNVHYEEKYL